MHDIPELMKRIKALKDKGVTGESVAYSFFERRIQPLQQRVHLSFEYQGETDLSRMAKEIPSNEEILRRVTRLFTVVHLEPYIPKLYSSDNSPDPVSVLLEYFLSDKNCFVLKNFCCCAGRPGAVPFRSARGHQGGAS